MTNHTAAQPLYLDDLDKLEYAIRSAKQNQAAHWSSYIGMTASDALALIAQVRAAQPKREMPPEMKAAIEEAHKTGATDALLPDGSAVFINYGHDYGDNDHLCCTACGGSGHIEDQQVRAAKPESATGTTGASIDTPEFRKLLCAQQGAEQACRNDGSDSNRDDANEAWDALIAHIDAIIGGHRNEVTNLRAQLATKVQGEVRCAVCGSDEPRTGTCGSDDPRALCNLSAPASAQPADLLEAARETLRMHDEVTGGQDYGYISPNLRAAVAAAEASAQPADRPEALSYADAAQWCRDNGLKVPPQWEASAQPDRDAAQCDDERDLFEEWAMKEDFWPVEQFLRGGDGEYMDDEVHAHFVTWQAARARLAVPSTASKPIAPLLHLSVALSDEDVQALHAYLQDFAEWARHTAVALTTEQIDDIIQAIKTSMNIGSGFFFPRGWNVLLDKLHAMRDAPSPALQPVAPAEPLYSPQMYRRIIEAIGPLPLKGPTVADFVRELVSFYHEAMAARRALGFLPDDAEVTPEEIERTIKSVSDDMVASRQKLAAASTASKPVAPYAAQAGDFDAWWSDRVPETDDSLHAKVFAAEIWNASRSAVAPSDAKGKADAANAGGLRAFTPTEQQYAEWCERHDLPDHLSRDAFSDAASLYLTATSAADEQMQRMRAAFHVNMLRAFPDKTHAEIDAEINRACGIATPLATSAADAKDAALTQAARDVLVERRRQIEAEGWTPMGDDKYRMGELSTAAACYALTGNADVRADVPQIWPWAPEWWKPTGDRRNLVKAGALILAEIERLDRAAMAAAPSSEKGKA